VWITWRHKIAAQGKFRAAKRFLRESNESELNRGNLLAYPGWMPWPDTHFPRFGCRQKTHQQHTGARGLVSYHKWCCQAVFVLREKLQCGGASVKRTRVL